jgi:outer membrane biogenesis lipoprotein LolB
MPTPKSSCQCWLPAGETASRIATSRRVWIGSQLALASSLVALSGCSVLRRSPSAPNTLRLGGRASISVGAIGTRPAHREAFEFEWVSTTESGRSGESGQLSLLGPLGQIVAQFSWTPQRAQLRQSGETQDRIAATPEDLSESVLGERLPVQVLGDWLQGRPWAQAPAAATPEGFEQLGWQIDARRLRSDRQGSARRSGDDRQASATLRWVLDESLPPAASSPGLR